MVKRVGALPGSLDEYAQIFTGLALPDKFIKRAWP
jgi:hypothetical protein